ncbi:MAG TPA: response regulator [Candidatus Acidoferrum sp.]|nr:response regulator [Candidatus Acidoferrum sp.]
MELPNTNSAGRSPEPPPQSLHVLCIDDDEQILESLKDSLGFFGHRIKVASGGKRGVEMFCTAILKSEPFDVVITDLNMPDLDGYEVTRLIKVESSGTPVILLSGLGTNVQGRGVMSVLVDAVVSKPARMGQLNQLILELVRKTQEQTGGSQQPGGLRFRTD